MREIRVPRVTARAFDKNRRASDLLKRQVAQLEHVVEITKGAGAVTMSAKRVRTEGQAAAFIAEATRALNMLAKPVTTSAPAVPTHTPERARGGGSRTRPVKTSKATAPGTPTARKKKRTGNRKATKKATKKTSRGGRVR